MKRFLLIAGVWVLAGLLPVQAQKSGLKVDDLFRIRTAGAPALSPDGRWIVYPITETRLSEHLRVMHLYRVSFTGTDTVQLTSGKHSEWGVRWDPAGRRIAFLSNRSGSRQVWMMNPFHGEPWQVTDLQQEVLQFSWSNDGTRLALVIQDTLTAALTKTQSRENDRKIRGRSSQNGHLYVWHFHQHRLRRLTSGAYSVADPVWAPDDRFIYFVRHPISGSNAPRETDIYMVAADSGAVHPVAASPGAEAHPLPSPDGRWLAFSWWPDSSGKTSQARLAMVPAVGGEPILLAKHLQASVRPLFWSIEKNGIYFVSANKLSVNLFFFSFMDRSITNISEDKNVLYNFSFSRDGRRVAFNLEKPDRPSEIYSAEIDRFEPRRLTFSNPWLRKVALATVEEFGWVGADSLPVEGLLVKPLDYRSGTPAPLVVRVHGGPAGGFRRTFQATWRNPAHILAALGYATFLPNFRGSSGYGEKFLQANEEDWNGALQDILSGVDSLVALGVADPQKLGISGWSFGSYLACRAITQTNRFGAAVAGIGSMDLFSKHLQSDLLCLPGDYFEGGLFSIPERIRRISSLEFVHRVNTPLLLFQIEETNRGPLFEITAFYQALKELGKKTRLVTFPGQKNEFFDPVLQKKKVEEEIAWLDRYLQKHPSKPAGPRIQPENIVKLPEIGEPQLSPNGDAVLYTYATWDADKKNRISHIYRIDPGKNQRRLQLTGAPGSYWYARWHPQGKRFAVLSDRGGITQIFLMNSSSGEPRPLTSSNADVESFCWSPDGESIAYITCDKKRREGAEDWFVVGEEKRLRHLWILDVKTSVTRKIAPDNYDVHEFDWSPDGRWLVLTYSFGSANCNRTLALLDSKTGTTKPLAPGQGEFRSPKWSPDGRFVAVVRDGNLWLINRDGRNIINLTEGSSMVVREFVWLPEAQSILFLTDRGGVTQLFQIDIVQKVVKSISDSTGFRTGLSVTPDGTFGCWLRRFGGGPAELVWAALNPFRERRLTDRGQAPSALVRGQWRQVRWASRGGGSLTGLLVQPPEFEPGLLYPAVIILPDYSDQGISIELCELAELLASNGYLILLPALYGAVSAPTDNLALSIDKAYSDLFSAASYLINECGADSGRMGVWGWGFGGFLAEWAAARSTRFKTIVAGAVISDWPSLYGQTMDECLRTRFFQSSPYSSPRSFIKRSPLPFIGKEHPPVLLFHGLRDERIPPAQSKILYRALRQKGIPTRLVLYPREKHTLKEYDHRVDMLRLTLEWFDRYLWPDPFTVLQTIEEGF